MKRIEIFRSIVPKYRLPIGRRTLAKLLLFRMGDLPERATFKFRFGTFEDVSIKDWPYGYRDLFIFGEMDWGELRIWEKIVKPGWTVVDVGANCGYWTLVASCLVGRGGSVFSFEPVEETFNSLAKNVLRSNLQNVKISKFGLSDERKLVAFNISSSDGISGSSSQGYHDVEKFDRKEMVELNCLDGIWPIDAKIDFVKIDIEGGELFALRGMSKILNEKRPIISFEWNLNTALALGYHPDLIVQYLLSLGYCMYMAHFGRLRKIDWNLFNPKLIQMLWAIPNEKISTIDAVVK